MTKRAESNRYVNLHNREHERDTPAPWYWRLIALAASWMILGGYLILPGLYTKDPQLKFGQAVLSVFVVALLTAGYSFTALLCFACRNDMFQAEAVFLPALTSSAIGLLTIAYNFLSSHRYEWATAAITGTVISTAFTILYATLLLWTHRRIIKIEQARTSRSANVWLEQPSYTNYIQNMYPATASRSTSVHPPTDLPLSEDDGINQQMAMLLMKSDSGPSPDASSTTFRIDLPEDQEERYRMATSSELVGTPLQTHTDWKRTRGETLTEARAWEQCDRGRTQNRSSSIGAHSSHSRGLSREERRREIEMGRV